MVLPLFCAFFTVYSKPVNINVHAKHLWQGLFMPVMRNTCVCLMPVGEIICKMLAA